MRQTPTDHDGVMSKTNTHDLQSEFRSSWRTGPVPSRPDPDDSKIDGVRGGFGRRYGIDPVLFRVPRPRSRLAEVTLGLALIATAVDTGLSILGGFTWLDTTRIAAIALAVVAGGLLVGACLLYTSPSPRDKRQSRMPSSA